MTNPVVPTPIQALPPAPLVTDTPAQFDDKAFPFAAALDPWGAQANVTATQAYTNAVAAKEGATDAQGWVADAQEQAERSEEAKNKSAEYADKSASSANFYGPWSALSGELNMPATVEHDGKDWRLMRNLADVTAAEPGVSDAWEMIVVGTKLKRQQRSSNVQLIKEDSGQLIDITSGTFTQTFASVAALGADWWCYLQNSGTGDITLDPNGAETIDGLTSYVMYPNEVRLVQCDGVTLRSVVLNAFYKTFTASGTFAKPPGYTAFGVAMIGGGGSGAALKKSISAGACGGGGGSFTAYRLIALSVPSTETVVIGAGAASVTSTIAVPVTGSAGGSTSFGAIVTLGGQGGRATDATGGTLGGAGGVTGSDSGSTQAQSGGNGGSRSDNSVPTPAQVTFSGAGGGSASGPVSSHFYSPGGVSIFGGSGGAANTSKDISNASPGNAPGGGGGGCLTATVSAVSGAGARGELRIWGVI